MIAVQYASAIFAAIAACLWFWSALVKVPRRIQSIDCGSLDPAAPEKMDDIDRLTEGLWRQSRLSALAAVAAGIAAVLQAIVIAFA